MDRGKWFEKKEYRLHVCKMIEKRNAKKIAEIGVWQGGLSMSILQLPVVEFLLMVDPWAVEHAVGAIKPEMTQSKLDAIYRKVCDSTKKRMQAFDKAAEIWRLTSVQAAAKVTDGTFDFVHIDGNHKYDYIKADIEAWRNKVKPGGSINGDDYNQEDVARAVDEAFDGVEIHGERIWEAVRTW